MENTFYILSSIQRILFHLSQRIYDTFDKIMLVCNIMFEASIWIHFTEIDLLKNLIIDDIKIIV